MANNNKKNRNNVNQPRRKRNKKPVKRYSEEYSNRPNPYTGYSADGNYHPEAKTHTLDKSATFNVAEENINVVESETAAKAVKITDEPDIVKTENHNNAEPLTESAEDNVQPEKIKNPNVRNSGHRKKNSDKEAAKKAKQAKNEARKAAVDKIAKGVAAHEVSEQIIDDITSMSDVIAEMAKAENVETDKTESINWNDLCDSTATDGESEDTAIGAPNDENTDDPVTSTSEEEKILIAKPVELGDDDVLPFDLMTTAESDKFDSSEDTEEPKEEESEIEEEKTGQTEESTEIPPLNPTDLIPILDFDKPPQPVLNFTEPQTEKAVEEEDDSTSDKVDTATIEEILNAVEQEKLEAAKKVQEISRSEDFSFGSEVIFDTSKSEGWDEIVPPPLDMSDENSELNAAEIGSSDSVEEISKQLLETYLELENTDFEAEAESASETDKLSITDENSAEDKSLSDDDISVEEFISDNNDAKAADEILDEAESMRIAGDIFVEDDSSKANDISVDETERTSGSDTSELDIAEIEDTIFSKTDISEFSEETAKSLSHEAKASETENSIVAEISPENREAVKEKIEKLIEAAELAEILRQESEDNKLHEPADNTGENSVKEKQASEHFRMDLHLDDDTGIAENIESSSLTVGGDEVKEYQPHEKVTENENVFESVLIVDDTDKALDTTEFNDQDDTLFLHSKEPSECPTAIFKLPEGPIILPTDIDDGDFQEQWLDEDEDGDEMASRSKRARRRISAFIGAVTVVLVLMIFVGVVKTAVMGINNIGGTGEKKAEYTEFISPVVINDPDPFETVDTAENQMLLESSIWCVLLDKTADYSYNYDATGKIILPADEVAAAGNKLFGNDVKLNMDVLSESDGNTLYYYDSIDNSFHISTGGIVGPSANITKIAQKSDYVSLIVGYSSQADMNLTSSESDEVECYKYMEYILAFNSDGSYYIQSIRDYTEE